MKRKTHEELRSELGYFENYVEFARRPRRFALVRVALAVVGLAVALSLAARLFGAQL